VAWADAVIVATPGMYSHIRYRFHLV
jgi:hypothetical protein